MWTSCLILALVLTGMMRSAAPVAGTTHLGVGKVTVWGNDPINHKDAAWKICYEVETDGPGVFIRTHPKSDYVWADRTKHPEPEVQQSVKVIDKKTHKVVKPFASRTNKAMQPFTLSSTALVMKSGCLYGT